MLHDFSKNHFDKKLRLSEKRLIKGRSASF